MFDMRIINGTVVGEAGLFQADIYICDEKIALLARRGTALSARETLDAGGLLAFPGAVDVHAHLGDGAEALACSTSAAALGGVTTCIDMPINTPPVANADRFRGNVAQLAQSAHVDFGKYGALLKDNQADLAGLHTAGALAYKGFLSPCSDAYTSPNLAQARDALRRIRAFSGLAAFHCEEYAIIESLARRMAADQLDSRQAFLDSRPLSAELIATRSIIELARETGCRVHICHVSHPAVAELVAEAAAQGVDVSAETCVHYLVFGAEDYLERGGLYKCAPPLRPAPAREGLWSHLISGAISCVASDHGDGPAEDRDDALRPVYRTGNGISGIQTMFQVFYDAAVNGRGLSPALVSQRLCSGPARRFGLYGQKGAIQPGFDADIALLDPTQPWQVRAEDLRYQHPCSAFVGAKGVGLPVLTMVRGKVVAQDGRVVGEPGYGKLARTSVNVI